MTPVMEISINFFIFSTLIASHSEGLCQGFHRRSYTALKDYLHNVTFYDVDGFPFQFEDGTHDGPPRYSIISYLETEGVYNWKEVGTYQNGKIRNLDPIFNATVREKNAREKFVTCARGVCQANEIKIPEG